MCINILLCSFLSDTHFPAMEEKLGLLLCHFMYIAMCRSNYKNYAHGLESIIQQNREKCDGLLTFPFIIQNLLIIDIFQIHYRGYLLKYLLQACFLLKLMHYFIPQLDDSALVLFTKKIFFNSFFVCVFLVGGWEFNS